MLTIGQVASRAGLRASAVRYYEAQGLLPAASRRGGKRVYDASILERLAVIALAKMAGFEVHEIRDLDEQISRLARMKDVLAKLRGCRCATLEECGRAFNRARSKHPPSLPQEPAARRRSAARRFKRRDSAANR